MTNYIDLNVLPIAQKKKQNSVNYGVMLTIIRTLLYLMFQRFILNQ